MTGVTVPLDNTATSVLIIAPSITVEGSITVDVSGLTKSQIDGLSVTLFEADSVDFLGSVIVVGTDLCVDSAFDERSFLFYLQLCGTADAVSLNKI